ncbi:MAG TPA: hypothetical protein VHO69_07920, partial [Phototrophicaceae bacterium]|nr:hypothetical protein [Phototrophicaceae bacterium]
MNNNLPNHLHPETRPRFRAIARALSLGPLAAVLVLLGFTISTPITISGALYLVGASAAAVGGWRISWGYR